jgi:hypothetical protein
VKLSLILTALLLLAAPGCKRPESSSRPTTDGGQAAAVRALRVTRATGPIKPDGELNEPAWNAVAARTGPFVDGSGAEARPYSEGRFLYDADNLYVALYAADNDIRARVTAHDGPVWTDDAFALHLTPDLVGPSDAQPPAATVSAPTYCFDISATGVVTDAKRVAGAKDDIGWESGIKVGVDKDGTVNDSTDEDEEWVVEAVIPLRSMGLDAKPGTRVLVEISRCDTPRNTRDKRCGSWGTVNQPRVIELAP